jgi:hypothetical protein
MWLIVACWVLSVSAFVPQHRRLATTTRILPFHLSNTSQDDDSFFGENANTDEFRDNKKTDDYDNDFLSLGINFGRDLIEGTDDDFQKLKDDCARAIDEKVQDGLKELNKLHDKWQRDLEFEQEPLEQAMRLNNIVESKAFNERVDVLVGTFMNATSTSREQTHKLAWEDRQRLMALEREQEAKKKKKGNLNSFHSWKQTNNEWDKWDEDDW